MQQHDTQSKPISGETSFWGELLRFAIIAFVVVLPVRIFIAQPFIVSGASMNETFANGQYLIVDELSYRFETPHRGDVIIFHYPYDTSKFFIKRVIGLPGETVQIINDTVTIFNSEYPEGHVLDEPYLSYPTTGTTNITLADDEYFVLGDNRPNSSDSRIWGPLKEHFIVGRAFLRLFPFNEASIFPGAYSDPNLSPAP